MRAWERPWDFIGGQILWDVQHSLSQRDCAQNCAYLGCLFLWLPLLAPSRIAPQRIASRMLSRPASSSEGCNIHKSDRPSWYPRDPESWLPTQGRLHRPTFDLLALRAKHCGRPLLSMNAFYLIQNGVPRVTRARANALPREEPVVPHGASYKEKAVLI